MYINRKAIDSFTSPLLRTAFYAAEGKDRALLKERFPECFSEDADDICVPASLLRTMKREGTSGKDPHDLTFGGDEGYESEFEWETAVRQLGIPISFVWSTLGEEDLQPKSSLVPDEVAAQLQGLPRNVGITFNYLGESFVTISFDQNDKDGYAMLVGSPILSFKSDQTLDYRIVAVLARFIDLNS